MTVPESGALDTPLTIVADIPGEPPAVDTPPAPETPPAAGAPPATPPPDTTPPASKRFKDHDSAEEGYANLRTVHDKTVSDFKALKADIEAREAAEKEKSALDESDRQLMDFSIKRRTEMFAAIEDLDPDADDHTAQVARLQAEADRDIRRFTPEIAPPAAGEASADTQPHTPALVSADDFEAQYQTVINTVTAAGLTDKDPVFVHYANHADPTLDLADQVSWAVTQTENYILGKAAEGVNIPADDPMLATFFARAPRLADDNTPLALLDRVAAAIKQHGEYLSNLRAVAAQETSLPLGAGSRLPATPASGAPSASAGGVDGAMEAAAAERTL